MLSHEVCFHDKTFRSQQLKVWVELAMFGTRPMVSVTTVTGGLILSFCHLKSVEKQNITEWILGKAA